MTKKIFVTKLYVMDILSTNAMSLNIKCQQIAIIKQ